MAISDEIRHQRKRLKGKGWKAYVSYFFTYYTWHVVAVIAVIIAVWSLVSTILNHKDQAVGVIFMNAQFSNATGVDYAAQMEDAFEEYAGIDTNEYEASVDTSIYQTPGVIEDTYDISASEKVSVQAAAGTLDAVVADAANFKYYSYSLAFRDLRDVLSDEQLERYADRLYYVDQAEIDAYQQEIEDTSSTAGPMTAEEGRAYEQLDTWELPDPDTMENPVPIGVVVTDAPVIQDAGLYSNVAVIYGFVQTLNEQDNAVLFLEYLFND